MKRGAIVEEDSVCREETHLTVFKTSLFFAGDGFTAYDSAGKLIFRVESYGPDGGDTGELVLMDPAGRCILTVRRKVTDLSHSFKMNRYTICTNDTIGLGVRHRQKI